MLSVLVLLRIFKIIAVQVYEKIATEAKVITADTIPVSVIELLTLRTSAPVIMLNAFI